ncbi:MAG: DUF4189 domain-containing protein [Lentilitoribacter sp.]
MKRTFLFTITAATLLTTAAFTQASQFEGGSGLNAQGQALGGNMRSGPGTNYGKISSVAEGTYLTILFDTGVGFDGYNWFEVALDNGRRGYIWGGILCSNGDKLWGVYASCATYQNEARNMRNQNANAGRGWMAFAVGHNGRWGHGAGPSQFDAQNFAINNCGDTECLIMDETQAQCHAMATVPGGHWFGAANSQRQAQSNAINFCTNAGANGCRIEYTYCQ